MISVPAAKRLFWPCLVLAAAFPLAASQKSVVMPLIAPSRWRLESVAKLPIEDLQKFGDQLDVDKELGVTSASERVYAMGAIQVTAVLEETADPSSAYALYTLYESRDMRPVNGVDLAVANSKCALVTRGRFFIRVIPPAGVSLTAQGFKSLLVTIGGARLSPQNTASLPPPLPSRGLQPGTEKYLLGPASMKMALPSVPSALVGFGIGAEVMAGTYVSDGERLVLVEINYPTPQLAGAGFKNLSEALDVNGVNRPVTVYGRQQGSYALLVLNAKSPVAARHLLDQFRLDQVVTQMPTYPRHDTFVLQLVELVIANGELVMIIVPFAILGGICIFLSKRLIMKLFPNSGLIRPDEDIVIRLKLT